MGKINCTKFEIFRNGATWVRTDFHLHTIADKEFNYNGNLNDFNKEYVASLRDSEVKVGIITNHNKFDLNEFKDLKNKALKNEIFLVPGVELSVNDGANGVHCLIAFNFEQWFNNGNDYIMPFLTSCFEGISNYENENTRCKYNLEGILKKLDEHKQDGRDSFIIMAHVEDKSGFLNEFNGGRIQQFGENELFRDFVIGFQKVRTQEKIKNLNDWLSKNVPVFVEGSDCKKIDEVGRCHQQKGRELKTFIKIGDYNFEAIKFALLSKERVSDNIQEIENAYIKEINFIGGKLDQGTISLNNNMNNFIGIRGSGKSSILESIRYCLDIQFGKNSKDISYKENLIDNIIGSGGILNIKLIDRYNKEYLIQRINKEKTEVYRDNTLIPNLIINDNLANMLYFGQKDLSEIGDEGFSSDLINKFFGVNVSEIRSSISLKEQDAMRIIKEIKELEKVIATKQDLVSEKAGLEESIQKYKDHNVEEKLKRQLAFEKENKQIISTIDFFNELLSSLRSLSNEYLDNIKSYKNLKSIENTEIFGQINIVIQSIGKNLNTINDHLGNINNDLKKLYDLQKRFNGIFDSLKEEFASIKREIRLPNLNPDDFVKMLNRLNNILLRLEEINKRVDKHQQLKMKLINVLNDLNKLWHQEFTSLNNAIKELNVKKLSISMEIKYKEDREKFRQFLEDNLRGTGITKIKMKNLIDSYRDTIEMYNDLYNDQGNLASILSGNQLLLFRQRFEELMETFLTYRVPDRCVLSYKGEELNKLSLGQRASALILFILTKEDKDIIIIDQPEDDLDNQSIYSDVIKELNQLKGKTQFIFATHNPNIPVLGDCEQVISCHYTETEMKATVGSIDCKEIQEEIINIMEGGKEAFEQRNKIYEIWSS